MTTAAKREKSPTHWRRIFAIMLFGGLMLAALAFAGSGRAAIETPPPPSVWSDQADYAPGETVTLSGANWSAGESVHIRVNDDAGETWRRDVDLTAAADGTISDQFNLPDWFVAVYSVTATGASSGTATWSFTDASLDSASLSVRQSDCTTPSTSFVSGSTVCVHSTVTTQGGGTNPDYFVEWFNPSNTLVFTDSHPSVTNNQELDDSHVVSAAGTWTVKACANVGCNGGNLKDTKTFTVTVNSAPVCSNGSATTAEDNSVATALSCTDADGNPLTYTVVSGPAHGSLSGTAPNLTYAPALNYNGPDSFTFMANDGTVDGNTATFSISVTEVNDPPVAAADSKSVAEDGSLSFPASDLTANDSEGTANESGQSLTVTAVGSATHGSVSLSAGTVTYTPDVDYNGPASFGYTVQDNGTTNGANDFKTAAGTVNVTVTEVNDAPVAEDDTATVAEDDFVLVDVLANDSAGPANESGQTLTIDSVGAPAHGTAVMQAGQIKYTPDVDYNGSDSFTYTAKDDGTTSGSPDPKTDTATVSVTITEANDAPTAAADSTSVAEDGSLSFPASDLTANDSAGPANESGQTLTVTSVDPIAGETHGTVSLVAGTVTYTTDANYNGPAKFHYTIHDDGTTNGVADPKEDTGDVNVTVTAVNDDPTISRDNASVSVDEGQNATNSGTFDDVDLGDSPPDHVTVSASVGTVTQDNSAKTWSWSYVPPDGPSSSTVTVTATDDHGAHASVTFSLTVANVAPNPTWTSYSDVLYGPLVFGLSGSWAGSFTDPGLNDNPWTATFAWGGVDDPSQTKTYGVSDPKTFSVRPNFASAGCELTGKVTVTDKDGDSGSDTKTVDVGTGEFMPPMTNQPVTDKLKNGQVLPVKVRIADCQGNPIAGLSPSIVMKEGDLTSEISDNTIDPITVTSVSAADTTGVMRAADGFYIYNLRINVAKLNQPYTIIVTPNIAAYPSSMTLRHKIIATK